MSPSASDAGEQFHRAAAGLLARFERLWQLRDPELIREIVAPDAESHWSGAPGSGFYYVIGDLLAALLCARVGDAMEWSIGYAVHGWQLTPGSRATAPLFAQGRVVFEDGSWRVAAADFAPGEYEFPQPLGPRPVVAYPVGEVITVPRHTRATTVRGWMSFGDSVPGDGSDADDWERNSFTIAVRAGGGGRDDVACASGRHIYSITAPLIAAVVEAVTAPGFQARGALASASVLDARQVLEALAASGRFDFRFAV